MFSLACEFCLAANIKYLLPYRLRVLDWRLASIFIATTLSVVFTLFGFYLDFQDENEKFVHDFFAAWCGGVAFFGLVGVIVSAVSLVAASEEAFETRARILVRGRRGDHIDDFIERLRTTLAHYTSSVIRKFTISDYDTATNMYLLRAQINANVCSFVDDVETVYASAVAYKPDYDPPTGKHNRLIRVAGVLCDPSPIQMSANEELRRPYEAKIEPGMACEVEIVLEYWVKAGQESVGYSPIRFSLDTTVVLDNQFNRPVPIRSQWLSEPNKGRRWASAPRPGAGTAAT